MGFKSDQEGSKMGPKSDQEELSVQKHRKNGSGNHRLVVGAAVKAGLGRQLGPKTDQIGKQKRGFCVGGPRKIDFGSNSIIWDGLWIRFGTQIGSKTDPNRFQDRFWSDFQPHLEAKVGPNSVQNQFWNDWKSDFKTNTFSSPIWERFLVDFEARMT